MSTITISTLPETPTVSDGTAIPLETSNVTKHITAANLKAYMTSSLNANVSAANAAIALATASISSSNIAMTSYVDAVTTAWTANATAQDTAISGLRANLTAANAAIITANTAMKGYVDTVISSWTANANSQEGEIVALQSNIGSFYTYANLHFGDSNYGNAQVESYIGANVGAYQTYANANASTQATSINTINANLGSFQTYANTTFNTSNYGNTEVAAYISVNANPGVFGNTQVGPFMYRFLPNYGLGGINANTISANNISAANLTLSSVLQFANLTTSQIEAITVTNPGMTVYNYTTGNIQVHNGTKWANITLS